MNANERFEHMAAKFYKETRIMAPGKDDCLMSHTYKERQKAWGEWAEKFYSELFDNLSPEWINVKDKLPKDQVIVNICGGDVDEYGLHPTSGYYDNDYGCFQAISDSGEVELMSADYWQSLPEAHVNKL